MIELPPSLAGADQLTCAWAVAGCPVTLVGAVVRYARHIARGDELEPATFDTVSAELGPGGVVELTVLAGYYLLLARYASAIGVELEPGVAPRPFA